MHTLGRSVRFSISPFSPEGEFADSGFNPYASRPAGEGLSIFLELTVEVAGDVEPSTGFVVNVADIDESVQEFVMPVFTKRIREDFRRGKHIGFLEIAELLTAAWGELANRFDGAKLKRLSVKLNPLRQVSIDSKETKMIYFSEKFEFAAMHKLWNDEFSQQRNFEVFGKCANPSGHGHNYIVEVMVKRPAGEAGFSVAEFERVVDDEFISLVDHKNLNVDVAEFAKVNPTVENISVFAWGKLADKFAGAELHCVTVWESDRTYCSYYG
jgi:6-pyruvoyltetrahydropterin/6-carboxytetrahydropterin synthase